MSIYKCPYCGSERSKKVIYHSWKGVAAHTKNCDKNTGEYVINLLIGPVHYSYFINNSIEQLKLEFGSSKYHDMLDKFRLNGYITTTSSKKYTKEDCIKAIQDKAKILGKTPTNLDFRKTDGKYPCIQFISEMFGSWNAALIASGFDLHQKSPLYGVPTQGLDKHEYRSKAEAYFADKFLFNRVDYIIEPKYPNDIHKWYDWYIPSLDLYIELDGQIRPEAIKRKIQINKELNRNCLFIPTYIIKSPNKTTIKDFMEYNIRETISSCS